MKNNYILLSILSLSFLMLIIACEPFNVDIPKGFVQLEDDNSYAFRAVSPNNSTLGIRYWDNKENGNLDFWYNVVLNYLDKKKGYKFLNDKVYKSINSIEGKSATFESFYKGNTNKYFICVFIGKSDIITVEFTSKSINWKKEFPEIEKVIKNIEIK